MIIIKDIQSEYKRAILESQKLYAGRRAKDTAGAVRYTNLILIIFSELVLSVSPIPKSLCTREF
jgi:hypothetical protein